MQVHYTGYPSGQDKPLVDFDLGGSISWWAVPVAAYCLQARWQNIQNLSQREVRPDLIDNPVHLCITKCTMF